jgi:hypothetical protein
VQPVNKFSENQFFLVPVCLSSLLLFNANQMMYLSTRRDNIGKVKVFAVIPLVPLLTVSFQCI